MSSKGKIPKSRDDPKALAKSPRKTFDPESVRTMTPAWLFGRLDSGVSWGVGPPLSIGVLRDEILPKMRNYESMTWAEIERNSWRDHAVQVANIIREAQERLRELRLDDLDELFRFRLSGEQRLWGIRDRQYFKILWWDPEHVICPSKKSS